MSRNIIHLKSSANESIDQIMRLVSDLDEEQDEYVRAIFHKEIVDIKREIVEFIEYIATPIEYTEKELQFLKDNKHLSHQINKIMELSGELNRVLVVEEYLRTGDIDKAVSNLEDSD